MKLKKKGLLGLVITAFYVAGIVAALHAALNTRTPTGAVAWSVSLVTLPFVAVPAYTIFGRNRFEGMADAFAQLHDEIEGVLTGYRNALQPWSITMAEAPSWYRAANKLSGQELVRGNAVELLINGNATFDSILQGIACLLYTSDAADDVSTV